VDPIVEAVYADSATQDLKFVNPELISQVHTLERRIEGIKRGMSIVGRDTHVVHQAAMFVEKWGE
jgi:hypothetical protein